VVGQSLIGRATAFAIQDAVQTRFQLSAGNRQPSFTDLVQIAAIPQLQAGLQNLFHCTRKLRRPRTGHLQHFATTP
jgi:hypothetical protein